MSSVLPFLTSLPLSLGIREDTGDKPSCYLVAKGLPTLPLKLVEKVWRIEYIEMEEFLPAPRSLQLVEQGRPAPSFQESLVGALNQFQVLQQDQRSQWHIMDLVTWIRCFTHYMAAMAKKQAELIPAMVAHLHTVVRLQQKAPHNGAWLE